MYSPSLHTWLGPWPSLLMLLIVMSFAACRMEPEPPIKPSEFTKQQRENLGDIINSAIRLDSRDFSILPNIAPYDEAYELVKKLFDQVTNAMHLDHQSPSDNRWDSSRKWEVGILIDDRQNAFILPGGHFYITTGFLKALRSEHELYYLLAFEATVMNEKYLLNRLITNYNTTNLLEVIATPSSEITPKEIALTLASLQYEEEDLKEADRKTIDLVCTTSIFSNTGLRGVYSSSLDGEIEWVGFRDYPGRLSLVQQLIDIHTPCGTFTTEGMYDQKVITNLP